MAWRNGTINTWPFSAGAKPGMSMAQAEAAVKRGVPSAVARATADHQKFGMRKKRDRFLSKKVLLIPGAKGRTNFTARFRAGIDRAVL